jgi:hypothetical protein
MTSDEIDQFIDLMCGYWPTSNIARNTVKSTWRRSMPLRSLSVKDAKAMLDKIKTMPGFPSLATVEQMAQKVLGWGQRDGECEHCHNDLWLYVQPIVKLQREYPQVVRCVCNGGSWEEVESKGGIYNPAAESPQIDRETLREIMSEKKISLVEALREFLPA